MANKISPRLLLFFAGAAALIAAGVVLALPSLPTLPQGALPLPRHPRPSSVAFLPDGQRAVDSSALPRSASLASVVREARVALPLPHDSAQFLGATREDQAFLLDRRLPWKPGKERSLTLFRMGIAESDAPRQEARVSLPDSATRVIEVAVSPDGARVVWAFQTQRLPLWKRLQRLFTAPRERAQPETSAEFWVSDSAGKRFHPIAVGPDLAEGYGLVWSPDSAAIRFRLGSGHWYEMRA